MNVLSSNPGDSIRPKMTRKARLYADYRKYIRSIHIQATLTNGGIYSHSIVNSTIKLQKMGPLLQCCISLSKLKIDVPSLNDDDLWMLSTTCKSLTHLSLVSGFLHGIITDESLLNIASNCLQLRHLVLKSHSPHAFTDHGLNALADGLKAGLVTFGLEYIAPSHAGSCSMPIISAMHAEDTKRLDASLLNLLKAHSALESLILDWPCSMNLVLKNSSTYLHSLSALNVGDVHSLDGIKSLISANPGLKSLILHEVDCGSSTLAQTLINIQIRLNHLVCFGVSTLDDVISTASQFSNLSTLIYKPSSRSANISRFVPDDQIESLVSNCPRLMHLHIPIHSDASLLSLSNCHELTTLNIIGGQHITNQGLALFSLKCKGIQHLNLGQASFLSDHGILLMLRSYGPQIKSLILPIGAHLTSFWVPGLSKCVNLEILVNVPVFEIDGVALKDLSRLHTLVLTTDGRVESDVRREVEILKMCKKLRSISFVRALNQEFGGDEI